jgi:molybdopterin converting factor small subunit
MAQVFIPAQMRDLTSGAAQLELSGRNIGEIINALDERFPGIASRLCREGAMAPGIAVAIDGVLTPRGLLAAVQPENEIHFLPAIGGG